MASLRRRAILRLVRFQNAVEDAAQRSAEAAEMDHAFDAGEFSGPAHGRYLAAQMDRIARRFGFTTADVAFEAVRILRCATPAPWEVGYLRQHAFETYDE